MGNERVSVVATSAVRFWSGNHPNKMDRKPLLKNVRAHLSLYLISLPGLFHLLLFSYAPMSGIIVAFKRFMPTLGVFRSPWNGLRNFEFFFTTPDAWRITRNTILLNLLFLVSGTIAALAIAVILNEMKGRIIRRFIQSTTILPYFLSWMIVGVMAYGVFAYNTGFFNNVLTRLGLSRQDWYLLPAYWPAILAMFSIWKGSGMSAVIYLAAMAGIDLQLYEAARIDGGSRWQCIRYITLPLLKPTISILVLLAVGRIFTADFGMIFALVRKNAILYSTTDVIDFYVFRALADLGDYSMAAAAGLYQSLVGFALVLGSNWLVRRLNPDNALF